MEHRIQQIGCKFKKESGYESRSHLNSEKNKN